MRTLVLIGIPGSGKSTFAMELMERANCAIISPDHHLYETTNTQKSAYVWTPQRAAAAWRASYRELGSLLNIVTHSPEPLKSDYIVWDATMTSGIMRSALTNIVGAFMPVDALYFDTPLDTCLERNSKRPDDRKVPEEKFLLFMESLEAPTYEEGFTLIHRVTPDTYPAVLGQYAKELRAA